MYQPRVFCVKLQLHFGGDIQEISVPAYNGAEPTVADLMTVIEREYRVPRALQNIVFHGQDLHSRGNEPLSRFGIKNGAPIRLVGRMVPPDMISQINAQYGVPSAQDQAYLQQLSQQASSDPQSVRYVYNANVSTQYDPPSLSGTSDKPPTPASARPFADDEKPPATPK